MKTEDIHEAIPKGEDITLIEEKDHYIRELEAEIIKLKADVTKCKEVEEALRRSEEKFSKAFYNNQAGMSISRLTDNVFLDVNRKFTEIFGYNREELIGKCALDLWGDLQERDDMLQHLSNTDCIENFESTYRKKSGELGVALSLINIFDIGGEKYLMASAIDITERNKAEEDMRLSQELFYKTFNANPLSMAIASKKDGIFLEVNDSFTKIMGYTREEIMEISARDINLVVDANDVDIIMERIDKERILDNFEVKFRKKSGNIATVLLSAVIICWKNQECILGVANDISELRRYEHEITRLDCLNVIGEISASIAHEIRNPMTTVKGFLQLFRSQDRYIEDREYMNLMIEEMERANAIITEFLSLAKNKSIELKWENLNNKIEILLPLLKAEAMKKDINIKLELNIIPDLLVDEAEIRQLILNLVLNGLDAMSPGGNLTINTCKELNEVTLAIQDEGSGITPEVLDKIGTPFFTTKAHGSGLGLAVCYNIAQRHNARIEVETGPAGTVFKVIFPVRQDLR